MKRGQSYYSRVIRAINSEYSNREQLWHAITDYVMPTVKYHTKPNINSSILSKVSDLVTKTAKMYMQLCVPSTKSWLYAKTFNEDSGLYQYHSGINRILQTSLVHESTNFHNEFLSCLENIFSFGQALLEVKYNKDKKSLLYSQIPQYQYRILYKNSEMHYLMFKKRVSRSTLESIVEDFDYVSIDDSLVGGIQQQGYITYMEVWENTKQTGMSLGQPVDAKDKNAVNSWTRSLIVDTQQFDNPERVNAVRTDADKQFNEVFLQPVAMTMEKSCPFVYLFTQIDNDYSYGVSPIVKGIQTVRYMHELAYWARRDLERAVSPQTYISSNATLHKAAQHNQNVYMVNANNGSIRDNVMTIPTSGQGLQPSFAIIEQLSNDIAQSLNIGELLQLTNNSNGLSDIANTQIMQAYESVYPHIMNVLTRCVQPILEKGFETLINHGEIKKTLERFDIDINKSPVMISARPPILIAEEMFGTTQVVDNIISKLKEMASISPDVFDYVNFDAIIKHILSKSPDLSDFIRDDNDVAQIRQGRQQQAQLQSGMLQAEIEKNLSLAKKHNSKAQSDAIGGESSPFINEQVNDTSDASVINSLTQ